MSSQRPLIGTSHYSETGILGDEGSPTIYAAFTLVRPGRVWTWQSPGPGGWMQAGSSDLEWKGLTIEEWWIGPEETRNEIRKYLHDTLVDLKERGIIRKFRVGNTSARVPLGPVMRPLRRVRK